MYRFGRPKRIFIQQDVQTLTETHAYARQWVTVKRLKDKFTTLGEQVQEFHEVYVGEALVRPGVGTTQTFGLGTVENAALVLLILGKQDVRQGDVVTVNDGREYEVQLPPNWFDAYTELRLGQRGQIAQPVQ